MESAEPSDGQRLRVALGQLAEQDPLIDVRQDDTRAEISVSLYGEVQREVIEATLGDDYGLAVDYMGSLQPLPNGNVFVGFGSSPYFSVA